MVIKVVFGFLVIIEFVDVKIKEVEEIIEVDVCLVVIGCIFYIKDLGLDFVVVEIDKYGFILVNSKMVVLLSGELVFNLWVIGDVIGKMMLVYVVFV